MKIEVDKKEVKHTQRLIDKQKEEKIYRGKTEERKALSSFIFDLEVLFCDYYKKLPKEIDNRFVKWMDEMETAVFNEMGMIQKTTNRFYERSGQ